MSSTNQRQVSPIALLARFTAAFAMIAVALSVPSFAQGAGCVDVDASVDPPSVCAGDQATFTASIENCGDKRDKVRARIMISGPGVDIGFRAVRKMKPGSTKQVSRTLAAPGLAAPNVIRGSRLGNLAEGTYEVVVQARSKRGGSDMAMTSLTVTSCP